MIQINPSINRTDMIRCALCGNAACNKACEKLRPSRLLRSIWFGNEQTAVQRLPEENPCLTCSAPCENACAFHTRLVRNIMRALAVKTLELNRKIDILSRRATADRLIAYLRTIAKGKGSREFDIPLDRQGLADYLCVERSALSEEISRLCRAGVISSRKSHFALLKPLGRGA